MTEFDLELEDIYNQIMYYPNKIYEIFCDFFGEEHVDLQNVYSKDSLYSIIKDYFNNDIEKIKNEKSLFVRRYKNVSIIPYILVWFPKLKITNEYDESVEIEDLWARVNITYTGKMYYNFKLNRSTYLKSHVNSDYMHSHVCGINEYLTFQECCLGTGPIKNTCCSLQVDYDESLWQLFCFELSKYVQTESIAGVPYRRMSSISNNNYSTKINNFVYRNNYDIGASESVKEVILNFTKDFLKKELLKFNYFNGSYGLGMSFLEYMLVISNYFIEWYNEKAKHNSISITPTELYTNVILLKAKIINNSICLCSNYSSNKISSIYSKLGTTMFNFKGKDVVLNIIDDSDKDDYTTILNIEIATAILNSILKTLNINYE